MAHKTFRFRFVLTQLEKDALAQLAEIEGGWSEAATVRRLIRRAVHDVSAWMRSPRLFHMLSFRHTHQG